MREGSDRFDGMLGSNAPLWQFANPRQSPRGGQLLASRKSYCLGGRCRALSTRIQDRRSSLSRKLTFIACAGCALAPAAVVAHHSRANYDMTKVIVVEGTVAALAWTNPHISMTLETQDPGGEQSRLEIELSSVSEALALGLKKEAIEPGSRVVVRVHPGRSGPDAKAAGLDVRTSDGTVYPLNIDARLAIVPAAEPASGITGHWAPTLESYRPWCHCAAYAGHGGGASGGGRGQARLGRNRRRLALRAVPTAVYLALSRSPDDRGQ
jgi:Family of unknown function (DUF6152)